MWHIMWYSMRGFIQCLTPSNSQIRLVIEQLHRIYTVIQVMVMDTQALTDEGNLAVHFFIHLHLSTR